MSLLTCVASSIIDQDELGRALVLTFLSKTRSFYIHVHHTCTLHTVYSVHVQVHLYSVVPHQMLAYNLSPSFNWDASGMTDEEMSIFNDELGSLGYVWQFITLAGFHANGLVITKLARSYADRGILSFVQDIQRQERENKVELLKQTSKTYSTVV